MDTAEERPKQREPSTEKAYARVAVFLPLHTLLDYLIPFSMRIALQQGMRVLVPLGTRKVTGCVVDFPEVSSVDNPKEIMQVLDETPLIHAEILSLTRWMAEYYCCTWGEAIRTALPGGINPQSTLLYTLTDAGKQALLADGVSPKAHDILALLMAEGELRSTTIRRKVGGKIHALLHRLEQQGYVASKNLVSNPVQPKRIRIVTLNRAMPIKETTLVELARRAPKQAAMLQLLLRKSLLPLQEVLDATAGSYATLKALVQKGYLVLTEQETLRDPLQGVAVEPSPPFLLNQEQQQAVEEIRRALQKKIFQSFLLHGVTGSGKTEVYLQAIALTLSQNREALVLAPEIALTPQLVHRFYARFGPKIAVLHSRLSPGERIDTWKRIQKGEISIVIGTRSALFAPLPHLGVIVVDEEHDPSYKQEDTPRYQARDLAVMRGQLAKAVVILGSATPSLESFFNVQQHKYAYLPLHERIEQRPLPSIEVVDMRRYTHLRKSTNVPQAAERFLSPDLQEAIQETLDRKEQILLFLNRRGYASFLQCLECGYIGVCPNCSVTLTYHKQDHTLRCHYCYYIRRAFALCPNCRGTSLQYGGFGTERIEQVIQHLFPQARIARMDRDTTRGKVAHATILEKFSQREIDILLGTQMITKGHDFPRITLVGVLSADTSLGIPDFRAAERTFQLITQVAGRAGRGSDPGRVIVQAYHPDHYAIQKAQTHDYVGFYQQEIHYRAQLAYPPYSRLVMLRIEGENQREVEMYSKVIGEIFRRFSTSPRKVEVLGPAPALISRIKNRYRWQLLLKGARVSQIQEIIREGLRYLQTHKTLPTKVSLTIDVDPMNLL